MFVHKADTSFLGCIYIQIGVKKYLKVQSTPLVLVSPRLFRLSAKLLSIANSLTVNAGKCISKYFKIVDLFVVIR